MKIIIIHPPATAPHRPDVRAGVMRSFNGYHVPGVASVEAWPHRGMSHARAIARRIVRDPAAYLAVINTFNLPGVVVTTNINISGARAA